MVRNYKRKSKRGSGYSNDDIAVALQQVQRGLMTTRHASRTYNIPYSTLNCYISGRRRKKSLTGGRPQALPLQLETKIANHLKILEKWGFGLSRKELFECIEKFVLQNNLNTPFKNNRPGEDWFLSFKKRNGLSVKKPQAVEYSRKKMTDPFIINQYFDLLHSTLTELNLFDKPSQIWNLDESSICSDPTKTKIVGAKGKSCTRVTAGSGKENTTFLAAANADGLKAPPLIVFKGLNVWTSWVPEPKESFPGMTFAASPKGWMTSEIFLNYFSNTLIPVFGQDRPILVVYDGHATHVTEKITELAIEHGICILKLPPHTSHLLQPLDLSVFKSFKDKWDQKICAWQRKHSGMKIPKKDFAVLLGDTWKLIKPEVIVSGFRKGGIYPFNRTVILDEKYDPRALERWHLSKNNTGEDITQNQMEDDPTEQNELLVNQVPQQTPGSSTDNQQPCCSYNFEDILLQTIKQSKSVQPKQPRKKIAAGAEVITANVAKQRETEAKKLLTEKGKNKTARNKICKKKSDTESDSDESESEPSYADTDDDMDDEEFSNEEEMCSVQSIDEDKENEDKGLKVGDYIIAEFKEQKFVKNYVGKITSDQNTNSKYICTFLRNKKDKDLYIIFIIQMLRMCRSFEKNKY